MPIPRLGPRLGPIVGGLVTSALIKRLGARHAGKVGLALTAWQLWRQYDQTRRQTTPQPDGPGQGWTPGGRQTGSARTAAPAGRRWSGRRPKGWIRNARAPQLQP